MPTYRIDAQWEVTGEVLVEARDETAAVEAAYRLLERKGPKGFEDIYEMDMDVDETTVVELESDGDEEDD